MFCLDHRCEWFLEDGDIDVTDWTDTPRKSKRPHHFRAGIRALTRFLKILTRLP
ncbi:hypothetical protein Gotur_004414, partial [Gossypium turneri]